MQSKIGQLAQLCQIPKVLNGPTVYAESKMQHIQEKELDEYIQKNFVEFWMERYKNKISFTCIVIVVLAVIMTINKEVTGKNTSEISSDRLVQSATFVFFIIVVMVLIRTHPKMVIFAIPMFILSIMIGSGNMASLNETYLYDEFLVTGF